MEKFLLWPSRWFCSFFLFFLFLFSMQNQRSRFLIKLWNEWENKSKPNLRRRRFKRETTKRSSKCITNLKFREPQRRLQINFSLFIASFFKQHSKDSRGDDAAIVAGIMQAENLCRFISPYGNDAHRGDKERHRHDSALCSFRFLCNSKKDFVLKRILMQSCSHFCWVENIKSPNWETNNAVAASQHISRGLNKPDEANRCI